MKPRFDAVVVGAGAGGSAMAWRLAQHRLRVLVLDAGPRFDPATDYRLHRPDWELGGFPEKRGSTGRYTFGDMQRLESEHDDLRSWNRVIGRLNKTERREISGPGYHHVRGIGGSTLHFTGEAHRMHPAALRMHSDFGVAADWPLTYAELEPYYCAAERLIGVAGPKDPGERWRSAPYPLPPHRFCRASSHLAAAGSRLNMHWTANPRAALSLPYDGRPACNYCANCSRGCPIGDKGSADVTFVRHAEHSGLCEIRPYAQVTGIETSGNRKIASIRYVENGKTRRIEAPLLVLAAGAIETPRLLLANRSRAYPRGVANGSGQVGRNLMETLYWQSTGRVEEQLHSYRGLPADAICWEFNRPNGIPGVVGGCRFTSATQELGLVGPIAYATRVVSGFGAKLKQGVRDTLGHALSVGAIGEFLPNADTFVSLDEKRKDSLGMPLARIHSRLTEQDLIRLRFMARTCRDLLQAAGSKEILEEYGAYDTYSSTHVFGTCRMGEDARTSVANAFGKTHEIDNLFIADASVFPSSGGGESPALTIQALAIRMADKIATGSVIPPSSPLKQDGSSGGAGARFC